MRSPSTSRVPASASRRSIASTSCGTIAPPKTRAKASPTVDSSLRSMRSTRPISPPASLLLSVGPAHALVRHRLAWPHGYLHGIGPAQRCGTNGILRIRSTHVSSLILMSSAAAGGGQGLPVRLRGRAPRVIGSPGCWGEWRNGRRAGFRCQCPSGRGGSSPPSPTNPDEAGHRLRVTRLDLFHAPKCHLDTVRPRVVSGVAHGSFLRMRLAYSAFVSMALLFSAACSTAVEGSAVKDTRAPSGPTIDISKLDVGPYPTEPSQPLGVTGDPLRGLLVEAQRMANNVVGPWEVDSALTGWFR